MQGLMQSHPLMISSLLLHAERHHPDGEIVSRRVEGDIHRYTYAALAKRARQVAQWLDADGVGFGDRVATLAWNGYRHMELYYGVSGSGRVLHTLNPRLHPDQIAWIINHAQDRVLCFDIGFLPIIQAIKDKCPSLKSFVALCDAQALPGDSGVANLVSYEAGVAVQSGRYEWPQFDEQTASSLCYTSGTTGHPKGVLYSHRSTILHAMSAALPDALNLSARDVVLPVVPMFHVNAWGLPYCATMVGCKMVFPGPALDGKSVYELMEQEQVTFSAGVPTVWQMLLTHMRGNNLSFSSLKRTVIGGSACPPAMIAGFQDVYGVEVLHAWGMTEMSPLGTVCSLKNKHLGMSASDQMAVRLKQGRAIFGVDMKVIDANGQEQAWDGRSYGDLMVRGPWILRDYYQGDGQTLSDGWFHTGDVATIDSDGFMQITDRSKDVIKSGGEWISSIDVENIAVAHPEVDMAACIGVRHPKWDERPIVVAVKKPGSEIDRDSLLAFYQGKIAKWQIPDDVVFVDAIPLGGTGKMQKTKLREMLSDYVLPELRQDA